MHLLWLPEAREDLERLFLFLLDKNQSAAEKMIRRVQQGTQTLLEFPEIGKPMMDDTDRRELYLPFGNGFYVLRYRIHKKTIVIIRVRHGKESRST